jgi:hypothetical protein
MRRSPNRQTADSREARVFLTRGSSKPAGRSGGLHLVVHSKYCILSPKSQVQVVIRMGHIQVRGPLPVGAQHAILMHTGHYRLADGSLLRVDVELGRFVGRLYNPELNVKRRIHGSEAKVHAWVDEIAAGYPVVAPHQRSADDHR